MPGGCAAEPGRALAEAGFPGDADAMLMATPARPVPDFVRARGGVRVSVAPTARGSAPIAIAETAGYRVRFPKSDGLCEGVLINTAGGMAGGDAMALDIDVAAGADAAFTTQSAEKIYRSEGPETEIAVKLAVAGGGRLEWLPQEQILFDGARFRRRLEVEMAGDAALTLCESVVFGRLAMGETLGSGAFHDRWRVRRGGRLVFAEDVRLDGAVERTLARAAAGSGARAIATVLHVAPDAPARRDGLRAALEGAACECGLSAWNGMLVARFLAEDPHALRTGLAKMLSRLRGRPVPRSWQA